MTRGIKVLIFSLDTNANVESHRLLKWNYFQSVLLCINLWIIGRVSGFRITPLAEIKSCPSAYQTSELSEAEFDRVQNRSKFGFSATWSEASGDVWGGQGWHKSCSYWSPLMFGSVWDCLTLIWNHFAKAHLPPTSQQTFRLFSR